MCSSVRSIERLIIPAVEKRQGERITVGNLHQPSPDCPTRPFVAIEEGVQFFESDMAAIRVYMDCQNPRQIAPHRR